jgi:hypothetical protein
VYIDFLADKGQLLDLIANIISGSIKMRTVSALELQADLVVNEDFDETRRAQGEDQFLFYRYYLDIVPMENARRERYVASVGGLLEGFWKLGYKAVAACDFEEELPRNGGYKTSSTK